MKRKETKKILVLQNGYKLFYGITNRSIGYEGRDRLYCYAPTTMSAVEILVSGARRLSRRYGEFFIKKIRKA